MRNLKQNPGPVAGHLICACCAAVVEVQQYFLAVFEYRMVFFAGYVYNRADTAGIVLPPNLIQTFILLSRHPHNHFPFYRVFPR